MGNFPVAFGYYKVSPSQTTVLSESTSPSDTQNTQPLAWAPTPRGPSCEHPTWMRCPHIRTRSHPLAIGKSGNATASLRLTPSASLNPQLLAHCLLGLMGTGAVQLSSTSCMRAARASFIVSQCYTGSRSQMWASQYARTSSGDTELSVTGGD